MSNRISETVADIYFPKIGKLLKEVNRGSSGRCVGGTFCERIRIVYSSDASFRIEFLNRKKMLEIYINYIYHRDIVVAGSTWFQDIRWKQLRNASQKVTDELAISILKKTINFLEKYIKEKEERNLRKEMNKIKGANTSLKNWA